MFAMAKQAKFIKLSRQEDQAIHDYIFQVQVQAVPCEFGDQLESVRPAHY